MDLRFYRSFSAELQKIAASVDDAGIRALLADRRGEEYLQGGELPVNESVPGERTVPAGVPIAKVAAGLGYGLHNYDLKAKKKGPTGYQKARDYAVSGVKGALTGGAVLALAHNMRGGQATDIAAKSLRRAAGVGAGASLADRAFRHEELKKVAVVTSQPSAPFRSPADALDRSSNVGQFENKVHQSTAKPAGLIGNKFRIP
jgi:hypothetical protein